MSKKLEKLLIVNTLHTTHNEPKYNKQCSKSQNLKVSFGSKSQNCPQCSKCSKYQNWPQCSNYQNLNAIFCSKMFNLNICPIESLKSSLWSSPKYSKCWKSQNR